MLNILEVRLFMSGKYGEKCMQLMQYSSSIDNACCRKVSYFRNPNLHFNLIKKHKKSLLFPNHYFPVSLTFSTHHIGSVVPVKLSTMKFAPKNSTNLSPILIMHGLFGSKTNWKSLAKSLSMKTGRDVYTLDARNHGDSPHTCEMSYFHMAADVVNFMEDIGVGKAILLGHSMGGRTAMTIAMTKPDIVEKLIVVDISPVNTPDSTTAEMKTFIRGMKEATQTLPSGISISQARALADQIMMTFCKDVGVRHFLLTNLVESSGHITWRVNLDVLDKTVAEGILKFPKLEGSYDEQTIFICGGNSNYVKKSDLGIISQIFKKAQFFFIPGTGHWVHAEKPEEFIQLVIEFVNQDGG